MPVNVRAGGGRRGAVGNHSTATPHAVETPSQRIIAAANAVTHVTSPKGVVLGIRQLGALDEMRVTRAIGADSSNAGYFQWCMLAAAVIEIDGDRLPMPQSVLEFEAVIQRIGDDGVLALMLYAKERADDAAREAMAVIKRTAKD